MIFSNEPKAQLAEEQAMLLKKTAAEESKFSHAENKELADDQNDFNENTISKKRRR